MAGNKLAEAFVEISYKDQKVGEGLEKTKRDLSGLQETGRAMATTGAMSAGKYNQAIAQLSYGVQDFAVVYGYMGLQGALRASVNNWAQVAMLVGGPVSGALTGLGITLGSVLIEQLLASINQTNKLRDSFDALADSFKRANAEMERKSGFRKALDIRDIDTRKEADKEMIRSLRMIEEIDAQTADANEELKKVRIKMHSEAITVPLDAQERRAFEARKAGGPGYYLNPEALATTSGVLYQVRKESGIPTLDFVKFGPKGEGIFAKPLSEKDRDKLDTQERDLTDKLGKLSGDRLKEVERIKKIADVQGTLPSGDKKAVGQVMDLMSFGKTLQNMLLGHGKDEDAAKTARNTEEIVKGLTTLNVSVEKLNLGYGK